MSTLRQRQPGPRWAQVVSSSSRTDSGFETNIDKASDALSKTSTSITAPEQQRGSFDPPRAADAPLPGPTEATQSQLADTHASAVQSDFPADERAAQKLQRAEVGPSFQRSDNGNVAKEIQQRQPGVASGGAGIKQQHGISGGKLGKQQAQTTEFELWSVKATPEQLSKQSQQQQAKQPAGQNIQGGPGASPIIGKWVAAPSAVSFSQRQPEGLHLLQSTPAAWSGDVAVAPASSAPDIDAILAALDGADSRPSALKAIQAGALLPVGAQPGRQTSKKQAKQAKAALASARRWDGVAEGPVGLASLLASSTGKAGHEAPATTGRGGRAGGGSGLQRTDIKRRAQSAERSLAALPAQASEVVNSAAEIARRTAAGLRPLPTPPVQALRDLALAFAAVTVTGSRNLSAAIVAAAPMLRRFAIEGLGATETAVHNAVVAVEERGPLVVQQTQQALYNAREATAHAVQAVRERAVSVGEEARRLASGVPQAVSNSVASAVRGPAQAVSSAAQTAKATTSEVVSSTVQTVKSTVAAPPQPAVRQQPKPQPKQVQQPPLQAQHLHASEWHVPSQQRSSASSALPQESISQAGSQVATAMVADERKEALRQRSKEEERAALLSKQAELQQQIQKLEHQRVAAEAAAAAASAQVAKAERKQLSASDKPLVAPGASSAHLQPQQAQHMGWQQQQAGIGTQPLQAQQAQQWQYGQQQQQQPQQQQQQQVKWASGIADRPSQWQGPIGGTVPLPMQASTPGLAAVMGGGRPVDGISSPFP